MGHSWIVYVQTVEVFDWRKKEKKGFPRQMYFSSILYIILLIIVIKHAWVQTHVRARKCSNAKYQHTHCPSKKQPYSLLSKIISFCNLRFSITLHNPIISKDIRKKGNDIAIILKIFNRLYLILISGRFE